MVEEEAIVHGTHRKWSQQERGSRRGSGSLTSFHHLLLIVPGCRGGFLLLPSLQELTSAAEAGSPFAAAGHRRAGGRGQGQPAEPELPGHRGCTGQGSACVFAEPAAACQEPAASFHVFYQICQFSKGS